jgi:FkbM family methyltransferase
MFDNLSFTLQPHTTLSDITEADIGHIHGYYYSQFRFNKSKQNINIQLENNKELLTVENFDFVTFKTDTCISDSLRAGILFEKFYLAFLSQFVSKDKNMLDIGANIGIWSVVFSDFVNKIYAFEPQPEIYRCLVDNIAINQCSNVTVYNTALSDKKTTYYMNSTGYDTKENFGAFAITPNGSLLIEADIGDSFNLSNIGFIKMDVEGHELEALNGLTELIQREKPLLFIEIHKIHPKSEETFKRVMSFGYKKVIKLSHCDYLFTY